MLSTLSSTLPVLMFSTQWWIEQSWRQLLCLHRKKNQFAKCEGYVWKRWLECCYKRLTVRAGQMKCARSNLGGPFGLSRPTNNRKVINTPCDTYKTNIKKNLLPFHKSLGVFTYTHTHFYLQPIQHYMKGKKTLSKIILTRVAHIYIIIRKIDMPYYIKNSSN